MRLVLLGPPGAGKGTQAEVLSRKKGLEHISTGDILRDAIREGSEVGLKAKKFIESGELVPDDIVIEIVLERIKRIRKEGSEPSFILDGFPRTKQQAVILDESLKKLNAEVDLVIYFETSPQVSINRLAGRRVCDKCGANYHIKNIPPKIEGLCDRCGGSLKLREDDKEETIKKRLEIYSKQTSGLIDYYIRQGKLRKVSGDLEAGDVFKVLSELFKKENLV